MATRSPFARRRTRKLERVQPRTITHDDPDPRTKRLMASCPSCGEWYSFVGTRMNNEGMYQVDAKADQCPHCGAEPAEVYPLAGEAYTPVGPKHESKRRVAALGIQTTPPAIDAPAAPAAPASGRVYQRAAQSRNTAAMGMDSIAESEE